MVHEYEGLTSELLRWIRETIEQLGQRQFANSLGGVQEQLVQFNSYRTVEKPPSECRGGGDGGAGRGKSGGGGGKR